MNILLLSNSAPNYHHFFKALVRLYAKDGAHVTVAVDSAFSREENGLDALDDVQIHNFADFFRDHRTDFAILARYAEFNLNAALLSDFERAQVYGIWGREVPPGYFDRLKSALLSFFEIIFEKHETDIVLYENVSNSFAHFALFVAQRKGATYLGLGGSRLPGRFSVSSDPLKDDAVEKAFNAIRAGDLVPDTEVRRWARDYIDGIETAVPDYMKINGLDQLGIIKRYARRDRIAKIAALLRHAGDSRTDAFQIGNPLLTHMALFRRNLARRMRSGRVRKLYQNPIAGERFLLYPLHFHPESSTSILAGTWLNEYEAIRNIAFNLPEGMRLYVKDHVSAWGYPNLGFYKRLRALPNVRLLPPEAPTKTLIRESDAVITLTSTVGYEALLLKRRVFLFGEVFYGFHKGVSRVENPARLHAFLNTELARSVDWDDAYNEDFVSAYHETTFDGVMNMMQSSEKADEHAGYIFRRLRRRSQSVFQTIEIKDTSSASHGE